MLSVNTSAFFELIKAGLWGKEVGLSQFGRIDFYGIYRQAEEQSVLGLVAAGFDHLQDVNVPREMALQFVGCLLQLEQQNTTMNEFLAVLIEKLRSKGVYTLLVKGQGVAQCYEKPLWRSCGDVDLFLSDDNYKKAKEVLIPLASSVDTEYQYEKHLGMTIDGWAVELHGHLRSGLSSRIDKELDAIQDDTFYSGNVRFWMNGKTQVFLLGAENDAVYVFTHILKHFYKEGLGLRQVCDWIRLLWKYRSEMDLRVLKRRIRKMGLMSEWKAFGAFAVEYLGMPADAMPLYSPEDKWKRKAEKICAFILEVGNMGHNRDMSHFEKSPYLKRKVVSLRRRCGDLFRHAKIFPLDSLKFFPKIMFNGVRSAVRGEG